MDIERPTNSKGLAVAMAVMNGLGVAAAFVVAAILILTAVGGSGSNARFVERALPLLTLGWVSGLVGLLLLIGLIHAVARINGRTLPQWNGWRRQRIATLAFIAGWPVALVSGQALAANPNQLSLALLPLCLILAIGLPLWWLLDLAGRGLKTPAHRAWGVSSVVMMVTLPLAMLVELFFIFVGGMLLLGMISNQPDLVRQLSQLSSDLAAGQLDPIELSASLEPFLRQPAVVFGILIGISVVVPLVEETLKPLGLWFLARRGFSPAQGFVLGATSGATFALIESLATLSSISGQEWALLVVGRAGTLLLHITCSALVGWGMGLAWTRAKYGRLAGLFLLSIAIHGVWNGFAQFLGLMPFITTPQLEMNTAAPSEIAILIALGLMVVGSLVLLIVINRRLNTEQAGEAAAAAQSVAGSPLPYPPVSLYPADASTFSTPETETPSQSALPPTPEEGSGDQPVT